MKSSIVLGVSLPLALAISSGAARQGPEMSLADFVNQKRVAEHLPGLAVVVVHSEGEPQVLVSGERRLGRGDSITPQDRMHYGSLTKAITGTVVGALVEQGRMTLETTIGESFPELSRTMRAEYKSVTVRQLLGHAGGIQPYTTDKAMAWAYKLQGTPTDQERAFLERVLGEAPRSSAGTKHEYSNAGGAIAGMMAARAGGRSYEQLVDDLVFTPIGGHALFGNPGLDRSPQPWGHVRGHFGKVREVLPTEQEFTVPRVFEAAGDASVSLPDYGRFLQLHLRGLRGQDASLKAATIQALHAAIPPFDPSVTWGMGWGATTIDGVVSHVHAGSAGAYIALATIQPSRDVAFAIVTNVGADGLDLERSLSRLRPEIAAMAAGR
jgi:CubicO group peptidase (beta-lactamase class C family)